MSELIVIGDANWEVLRSQLRALGGTLLEARLTDEALAGLERAQDADQGTEA